MVVNNGSCADFNIANNDQCAAHCGGSYSAQTQDGELSCKCSATPPFSCQGESRTHQST